MNKLSYTLNRIIKSILRIQVFILNNKNNKNIFL